MNTNNSRNKVMFKGTKSHGHTWWDFINDSHFVPRTKDEMYGIVFAIRDNGLDIWVHVFDKKTKKKLDESTWVFWKEDLVIV